MALQHKPTTGLQQLRLLKVLAQAHTDTVVWFQDMSTHLPLWVVQWGNRTFLPVEMGLRVGIGICNRNDNWRAFPTYIGETNVHKSGTARPDMCDAKHMWDVRPADYMYIESVVQPNGSGLPLVVERTHGGYKFRGVPRTETYRDMIRVFERKQRGPSANPDVYAGRLRIQPSSPSAINRTFHPKATLIAQLWIEGRGNLLEALRSTTMRINSWSWAPSQDDWFRTWTRDANRPQ